MARAHGHDDGAVESTQGFDSNESVQSSITAAAVALSPVLTPLQLLEMNKIATRYQKEGDYVRAVAAYGVLFDKARKNNLTHPELCVCHGNCSAACLRLGAYQEALHHAEESFKLSAKALHRSASRSTYVKSFRRRGEALMGLGRWREAADAFSKGMDVGGVDASPASGERSMFEAQELKALWREAERRLETEAAADDGLLLTWRTDADPSHSRSITYHPHSAPIHRIKAEDQLPHALLTPFQAENDPEIKETYNYMTVQADIRMPMRALGEVRDVETVRAYKGAIEEAVGSLESSDTDARVLNLSCGPGVGVVHAIRAGARHVTATDRWLYLSLAAKETMLENDVDEARYDVVYKRPTELRLREDVPVSCNVLVIGTAGVELESGVLLAAKHCFQEGLVMGDCAVLPGVIRVLCRLTFRGGAASEVREAWAFDLRNVYDRSETKELVFDALTGTRADGVEFWYELDLLGRTVRRPAVVQRLAGELVIAGEVVVTASHNTVGLRFDVSSSNYLRLFTSPDDASVTSVTSESAGGAGGVAIPSAANPSAASPLLAPYRRAIEDGVVPRDGVVLVPRSKTVPGLVECLEGHGIKTVTTDLGKGTDPVQLQRGRNGVPIEGLDAVMLYDRRGRYDMVEEWRTALGFTKVIPSQVTWWCVGVEAVTRPVEGVKLACLDRYRESGWCPSFCSSESRSERSSGSGRSAASDPHHARVLTARAPLKSSLMRLKTTSDGYMNAVVYWHDLDGVDGSAHNARIVYLDRAVTVEAASKVSVIGGPVDGTDGSRTFKLRGNVGTPRAMPPWQVTWGGGASVENPHYQRVHYCELILREFLGVVERGRTDIGKDVDMILRHCGSLFLDKKTVVDVGRRLRSMERALQLAGRGVKFSARVNVHCEDDDFCC